MGVVDEDGEGLAGVDRLEPPRNSCHRGDTRAYGGVRHGEHLAERDRAQHVLDIEPAAQADCERQGAARRRRDQRDDAARADLDRLRADVSAGVGAGVGEDGAPGLPRQPAPIGIVDVDRRRGGLEEAGLGQVVVLHVDVEERRGRGVASRAAGESMWRRAERGRAPPRALLQGLSRARGSKCEPGYSPCLAPASDYDCAGGGGDGPKYVQGPVRVTGSDPYRLDGDGDGWGCEP